MQRFTGKRILLGLCGGIAAYKACDLIRELYREGAEAVQVVMTASAQQFVTPLTLASLSRRPVLLDNLSCDASGTPWHIALAQQYDVFLILPATANTLGKLAYGLADDLLSTTVLTFTGKPVLLAPAMNGRMWANPIVQQNLATLTALDTVDVVPPQWGEMACGETGDGKLATPSRILAQLYRALHPLKGLYAGRHVLVSAGGTAEPIDAVRYLTNRSSGKMGVAIADELWAMGADVSLFYSMTEYNDVLEKPYQTQATRSVDDMAQALYSAFPSADGVVMAAAVSDFKAAERFEGKFKKHDAGTGWSLALRQTQDILETLGQQKQPHQFCIGFAAESDVSPEAMPTFLQDKLQRKNLDMLVCNDISRPDIGFSVEQNEVHLLFPDAPMHHLEKASKAQIAQGLLHAFYEKKLAKDSSHQQSAQQTAPAL